MQELLFKGYKSVDIEDLVEEGKCTVREGSLSCN